MPQAMQEDNLNHNHNKLVTLHAGELLFGKGNKTVSTILGSCVSVTLFHPEHKYSGICHFALPYAKRHSDDRQNPRYADACFLLFQQHAKRYHLELSEFTANIIGGGNMLEDKTNQLIDSIGHDTVGARNARTALELATKYNLNINEVDVGEFGYRKLLFNTATGELTVTFTPNDSFTP